MNPQVWVASGHVAGFTDPLVDCTGTCKKRWREDHLADERARARQAARRARAVPSAAARSPSARQFNLMFKTFIGPVEEDAAPDMAPPRDGAGHVRELRQRASTQRGGGFRSASRSRARAFATRSPRATSIFRLREFELMEMEYFCKPGHRPRVARLLVRGAAALARRRAWACARPTCGCARTRRPSCPTTARRPVTSSTGTRSAGASWRAVADRTDYDLKTHMEHSGRDLSLLRPRDQRALHPVRHRTRGEHRPHLHHAARRRVRRGGGARREARGAPPAPRCRARAGRGAAALQEGRAHRARASHRARPASTFRDDVRRDPGDRPSLSPPGRDRDATGDHLRLRLAQRPRGHHPRARRDVAGARAHRGASRCAARSARDRRGNALASGPTADTTGSIVAWHVLTATPMRWPPVCSTCSRSAIPPASTRCSSGSFGQRGASRRHDTARSGSPTAAAVSPGSSTSGISERVAATIGELPRTHGVLGALLEEGPILLDDIRRHPALLVLPRASPDAHRLPRRAHRPPRASCSATSSSADTAAGHFTQGRRAPAGNARGVCGGRHRERRDVRAIAAARGGGGTQPGRSRTARRGNADAVRPRARRQDGGACPRATRMRAKPSSVSSSAPRPRSRSCADLPMRSAPESLERDGLAATLADHAEALRAGGARIVVDAAAKACSLPLETRARAAAHRAGGAPQRRCATRRVASIRVTLRSGIEGGDAARS